METNEIKYCLYQHTRKTDGGIFYIGIGDNKRPYSKRSRNKHWRHIVNKHDYNVEILVDEISWERACKLEKLMISFYGRQDKKEGILVNLTDGGEGSINRIYSNETKNKIGLKTKERLNNGWVNPMTGRNHTEKVKDDHSERMKGRYSGSNNPRAKVVIDMNTGIFYENAKELTILLNKNYNHFIQNLKKNKPTKENLRYSYV
jgi:hypothetical protein